MTKVMLGMIFEENNVPDFGSIEQGQDGVLTLLNDDRSKLNSKLTRSFCTPYLSSGSKFSIKGGTTAIIADVPAVWRYHAGTDTWYEIINEL